MRRSSRSRNRNNNTNDESEIRNNENENTNSTHEERFRAIAQREASRLARPEVSVAVSNALLSKSKSSQGGKKTVGATTPFGRKLKINRDPNEVEEWCGPFSVARQMIAAREEARREQELEKQKEEGEEENERPLIGIVEEMENEIKKQQHPSKEWKGNTKTIADAAPTSKRDNLYLKRKKRFEAFHQQKIPSLFQLCLDLVVDNFDCVESLGMGVPSGVRKVLCDSLITKGKFNGAAFDVISEDGIESLELADCAAVDQQQLSEALQRLLPQGLRAIILSNCGRCFGKKAVNTIVHHASTSNASIFALAIGGAYLLTDDDAATLIHSLYTTLSSIEFKACPLLKDKLCHSISSCFSLPNSATLLELVLEDLSLTKEQLFLLNSADTKEGSSALTNLKQLKITRVAEVDDEVMQKLLSSTTSLQGLTLSNMENITDVTLLEIRKCNIEDTLRFLQLSSLRGISEVGLELLFSHDFNSNSDQIQNTATATMPIINASSPPKLSRLDLSDNGLNAVTDNILSLVLQPEASEHKSTPYNNISSNSYTNNFGGLMYLNISNSISITDDTMENIASSNNAYTLQELDLSFCPNVTDKGLGYLVSKAGNQLQKISIWGCAQFTNEFLDGHDRIMKRGIDDDGLDIVGVWMKRRKQ